MTQTAEEFLKNSDATGMAFNREAIQKTMIEFAKLHIDYVRSLQKAKWYAGETGYIKREEWEEIIENIK